MKRAISGDQEGWHFNERHVIRVQANPNVLGPRPRFGRPGMTFDGMCPVFDPAIWRQIGCWNNDNQCVGRQDAPLTWIAMNGLAGSTGHLHVKALVVLCRFTCLWLLGTTWRVLNRIILGAFAAVDALVGMGTEQMRFRFNRFVHCLVLKKQTAQLLAGLSGRVVICLLGLVVGREGKLDLPGWRKDLGSASLVFIAGQDRVDVVAELESHCLWGLAVLGVVNLDLHGEGDGFHVQLGCRFCSSHSRHEDLDLEKNLTPPLRSFTSHC